MVCGEPSEPPLRGLVEVEARRFRIWKHADRLRVETEDGDLCAIREPERLVTFSDDHELPVASGRGSFAFEDEEAPWSPITRPRLDQLELDDRRADGPVESGERFGRPTLTVSLPHVRDDDLALTLVVDAVTGMPFEVVDAGETVMRWLEFEVLGEIDEALLRWDGETRYAGWFAYVGTSSADDGMDHLPPELREQLLTRAQRSAEGERGLDLSPISTLVPLEFQVSWMDEGTVVIDLTEDFFVTVRGVKSMDPEDADEATDVWTTSDGWTWMVHATGVDDPDFLPTLRERISVWRATTSPSPEAGGDRG
ncbi:hypothetical protein SAMN06295964_3014 [Aeromicrobium choanae]|uniref:Uncharacterized protein n=2 Tax=Aeromicrobium choanae TaxID=1736691 RepID=A0A1T4Z804_9ACTN|nr:hypothetical protein SAMN06295964_3014 [Aeromicrobium choanae]